MTLQETHFLRKGRLVLNNMVVFKAIRSRKGGGTLCAINEQLNPKLIEEYNEPFQLLVVEIVNFFILFIFLLQHKYYTMTICDKYYPVSI